MKILIFFAVLFNYFILLVPPQPYTAPAIILSMCFAERNNYLISSSMDNSISVWQLKNGTSFHITSTHKDFIRAMLFVDSLHLLITGSDDLTLKVWKFYDLSSI